MDKDIAHRSLYKVFLDVRDAAAHILENTTMADLVNPPSGKNGKRRTKKKENKASAVLPMVVGGSQKS